MDYIIQVGLLEQAREIRQAVFVEEQGFQDEFDEIDNHALSTVLLIGGKAVATGRAFIEDNHYVIGRIAVLKEFRGNNYGADIMNILENEISKRDFNKIVLSAQVSAMPFYIKLGYKKEGSEYLDEHCPHIKMVKNI